MFYSKYILSMLSSCSIQGNLILEDNITYGLLLLTQLWIANSYQIHMACHSIHLATQGYKNMPRSRDHNRHHSHIGNAGCSAPRRCRPRTLSCSWHPASRRCSCSLRWHGRRWLRSGMCRPVRSACQTCPCGTAQSNCVPSNLQEVKTERRR